MIDTEAPKEKLFYTLDLERANPLQRVEYGEIAPVLKEIDDKLAALRFRNPYANKKMLKERIEELLERRAPFYERWKALCDVVNSQQPYGVIKQ